MPSLRFGRIAALVTVCWLQAFAAYAVDGEELTFDVPPATADVVVRGIAEQAGKRVLFPFEQLNAIEARGVRGEFTVSAALSRALDGTGLAAAISENGVITVSLAPDRTHEARSKVMQSRTRRSLLAGVAALFTSVGASGQEVASGDGATEASEIESIVVRGIGSRGRPRSATTSPVAIDTLSADDFLSTGASETGRALQELVPSFNFSSSSISDGTDSLRPATLRGLGPDQTLVLVNGKRRHKSALIHVNTSVGRGTAGTDINAIPPAAIASVEVLRDGASALYGSDAIGGVINFELKNSDSGGGIFASAGQHYEGDGRTFTLSGDKGLALGEHGFLNVTLEYRNRERTNRAGLVGTCQYLCSTNENGDAVADPSTEALEIAFERQSFRIGDSDSEQLVAFANLGFDLNDNAELYAFGSWGTRENESGGFYRRANQGARTLLDFYPNGFLPLIRPTVEDQSVVAGIDWQLTDALSVDTSVNYGANSFAFEIANSNNVSLGLSSPTVFDAGTLDLSEVNANVDGVYDSGPFALAFGAGFRQETYEILEGEPASYADGGFVNVDTVFDPVLFGPTAGAAGAQVFRGFSPSNAVDETRDSYSAYAEISADLLDDRVNGQAAVRYENYDGFGGTTTFKLAGLAQVFDGLAARGSVTTGFRAPSMQQLFFNSTSTQFVQVNGVTVAQERGTFRNDSALARGLGIPELKEEESFSWSVGGVLDLFENATLTVDYYSIDIDDRIMISGALGAAAVPADAAAVFAAEGANSGQFFINGVNTETRGVDIVGAFDVPALIAGGELELTAAANFTETEVVDELPAPGLLDGLDLVTAQDVSILEEWQPESRINLGGVWTRGGLSVSLQGQYYGEYTVCEGGCTGSASDTQTFSSQWLTDLGVDYRFDRGVTVSFGANNLFDVTPDENLIGQSRGGTVLDSPGQCDR